MRRAIVHVGMPRTGSTSLQELLAAVRPRLTETGILYPDLAPPGSDPAAEVSHQRLAESLDGRRPRAEGEAGLARLARVLGETEADIVFLSCEGFALQKPAFGVPAILRGLFDRCGFAMEVAIVVKPQAEQLNSAYTHRAQVLHESRTFREFCRREGRSGRFDYDALVRPWLAAAVDRVTAVPLRDARSDEPLLERIFRGLGLEARIAPFLGQPLMSYETNRSPGPIAVETSRRLHALRVHRQFSGHSRLIGHVLDQAAWSRGLDAETFRGRAPDEVEKVMARLEPSNRRFASAVWGAAWESVVAPAPRRPPNELAGTAIPPETQEQIAALTEETLRHFAFRRIPAWQRIPANAVDAGKARFARLVNYSSWRVA